MKLQIFLLIVFALSLFVQHSYAQNRNKRDKGYIGHVGIVLEVDNALDSKFLP